MNPKKPSSGSNPLVSNPRRLNPVLDWHADPQMKLALYARSFHKAAKALAGTLEFDSGAFDEFDVCPVVSMYRQAAELHLKAFVVGDGGNFLAIKPDPMSTMKTHSLSWLAQFVCQIVTAVKWEAEFKCEGVETLTDFKAVIEKLNAVDPAAYAFRRPVHTEEPGSVRSDIAFNIPEFARRVDALLGLLDATADALAAEWDLRSDAATEANWKGGFFEPPIQ